MSTYHFFVQFEFTHALGPTTGCYIVTPVRGLASEPADRPTPVGTTLAAGAADVLVMTVRGARPGGIRLRRRARAADPDAEVEEVALQLVSYVEATAPEQGLPAARARLAAITGSEEEQGHWVHEGLALVNGAIRAHRAGARDPYVTEVTRRDARRVRIGFGTTDEVREGLWTAAVDVPPPAGSRAGRAERLAPSEAVADALSGRLAVLESEDMLLRTHLDIDQGRTRAATHQALAALSLIGAECDPPASDAERLAGALDDVNALLPIVASRGLEGEELTRLLRAVDTGVRVLERRRHHPAAV